MLKVWSCKIGGDLNFEALGDGPDHPMRLAIEKAYLELTGKQAEFLFSGWGGELDEFEKEVAYPWKTDNE